MPVTGGLTDPLLYALIVGMVGLMFSYLVADRDHGSMQGMIPGMPTGAGPDMFQGIGLAFLAFFSPFLIIIGIVRFRRDPACLPDDGQGRKAGL